MASYTMPDLFKITVSAACPTQARTEVSARKHTVTIDEPPARQGTDLGPSPLETLLASFLGCTNVIANMIAAEMGIKIDKMTLRATAHFDTRGVFGRAKVTVPFRRVDLFAQLVTNASAAEIERLRHELAARCPVSVILRQAGAEIVEEWSIAAPPA